MKIKQFAYSLGRGSYFFSAILSVVLHLATFIWLIAPGWILVPAVLWVIALICDRVGSRRISGVGYGRTSLLVGVILLAYAVGTFIYVHKITNGATDVRFDNGQYFYLYKSRVIGTITQYQYLQFPNLGTRALSAWIAMLASFGVRPSTRSNWRA